MGIEKKVNILFIHHGAGYGGAPISLLNLILLLPTENYSVKVLFIRSCEIIEKYREHNIEVDVLSSDETYFKHHEKAKLPLYKFHRYLRIYRSWRNVANKTAKEYLEAQNVDIVHLNSDVLSAWAFAAKKQGKKVVCHNRDPIAKGLFGLRRSVLRKVLRRSVDIFVSISEDNKERLGLTDKTIVVYNFIPIPEQYRKPFQDSDEIRVLYLGGIRKTKGFKVTAEMLPFLNNGVKVVIGGSLKVNKPRGGRLLRVLKTIGKNILYRKRFYLLKKINNSSNVVLLGHTKEPLKWIDNCDILIVPFTVSHFSRPAIEAFAYGKPVIASDVKGMDEIVENNINGKLFKNNNKLFLAQSINWLSENKEVAVKMGEKGREKAMKVFSPEINMLKIENIYIDLVNELLRIEK